jgi:hypothetical protein
MMMMMMNHLRNVIDFLKYLLFAEDKDLRGHEVLSRLFFASNGQTPM